MDPTSVADPILGNNFGFVTNRHLYEWLTENEIHNEQIQSHYKENDRQYSSKQTNVNLRKIERGEIYDSIERTFEKRGLDYETGAGWNEDFLSNETDSQIKLPEEATTSELISDSSPLESFY